jgi:hypothetical protein
MSRRNDQSGEWQLTRWARSFIEWSQNHPIPGVLVLFVAAITAMIVVAQGLDWAVGKLWPPQPRIVAHEDGGSGGTFSVTLENATDTSMVVTEAVFRATRPKEVETADLIVLTIPAVTYNVPFDCAPGTRRVKLNPPFRVTAKDVAAVVFRSTVHMRACHLYVSLNTSQGQTKEQETVSPSDWRTRAP